MNFSSEGCDLFYRAPALLYGAALWLASLAAIDSSLWYLAPLICFTAPLLLFNRRGRPLLVWLLALSQYWAVSHSFLLPELPPEGIKGTALFQPEGLSLSNGFFGKQWRYKGTLIAFIEEEGAAPVAKRTPCSLMVKEGAEMPPVNSRYLIASKLLQRGAHYSLVPEKGISWKVHSAQRSLALWRYEAKERVKAFINSYVPQKRSADFLGGLTTGSFDDPLMAQQLGRFGLQHIMAISGFHFAIAASFTGTLLRLLLPFRAAAAALIALLTGYFIFLGPEPSILRAWLSILVLLTALLSGRRSSGLNALGCAIMLILIYDPLMVTRIGFQFSASVTAAILLFYPAANKALCRLLPKRPLNEAAEMPLLDQHGYCLLAAFRSSLALTIAVNFVALPLTLYHFQLFPLMSLVYNLFFPFLVSIALFLLMLSSIAALLLPLLGAPLMRATGSFIELALNCTYNLPPAFDFVVECSFLTAPLLALYFTLLAAAAVALQGDEREKLIFV